MTTWHTGPLERAGDALYVHLIRADDDPMRTAADQDRDRGWNAQDSIRGLNQRSITHHAQRLRQHLADRCPRTFNRIAVELYDRTADVAFGTHLDDALWLLVERREIEHTPRAPVQFRLRDPYKTAIGVAGLPVNPARPRWCAPGPADSRCDLCQTHDVPDHDSLLCPQDGCCWTLQVCERCGGFDKSRRLQGEHLDECVFSAAEPDRMWDDDTGQFVSTRQLALF